MIRVPITDRTCYFPTRNIALEDENSTETLRFEIDNAQGNLLLSSLNCVIKGRNPAGRVDLLYPSVTVMGNKLLIEQTVEWTMTGVAGVYRFQIGWYGGSDINNALYEVKEDYFHILPDLGSFPMDDYPTIVQQVAGYAGSAESAKNLANQYANNATTSKNAAQAAAVEALSYKNTAVTKAAEAAASAAANAASVATAVAKASEATVSAGRAEQAAEAAAESADAAARSAQEAEDNSELPVATEIVLGGIKVGENLSITESGVLSVDTATLQTYVDTVILGGAS